MKRFVFSLQSVLTIRQKALEDERINLARIMNIYNQQKNVLEQMFYKLEETKNEVEKYLKQDYFDASIIANYNAFSLKIAQDIKTQEQIIKKTEQDLKIQQEKAKEAYIKVKSLENLKEKQKEQYNKEVQLEEFKVIDDIINSRRTIA